MKKLYLIVFTIIIVFLLSNCKRDEIFLEEIIYLYFEGDDNLEADGLSTFHINIRIPAKSEIKTVKLNCDHPGFKDKNDQWVKEFDITMVNYNETDSFLRGQTEFKVPNSEGILTISALIDNYFTKSTVTLTKSFPYRIEIYTEEFSVQNNYNGKILVKGTIYNSSGKFAYKGVKVNRYDLYIDGSPVNGDFKNENLSSNSNSEISFYYSPGFIAADTSIFIHVIVLDEALNETNIKDSVELFIIH